MTRVTGARACVFLAHNASRAFHWQTLALFIAGALWLLTGFDSGYASARWLERTVAASALLLFALSFFGHRHAP